MKKSDLIRILEKMGFPVTPDKIHPFLNQEDGEHYNVWKIDVGNKPLVLKQAKGHETDTYRTFFSQKYDYVPELIRVFETGEYAYLLMEYIDGDDLRICSRDKLVSALDAIIRMQRNWWQADIAGDSCGYDFEQSLANRKNRLTYLNDPQLEKVYSDYLLAYHALPRTLCHDDLLPFNILIQEDRAVLIDWEYGGMLPYPTSIARLIAHGEESQDAFFHMTQEDKNFAITYYYEQFIGTMGISLDAYLSAIQLFLFYEYCEWVYVGNKYGNTSTLRYETYYRKAKELASRLGY